MKKVYTFLVLALAAFSASAQNFKVVLEDGTEVRNGSTVTVKAIEQSYEYAPGMFFDNIECEPTAPYVVNLTDSPITVSGTAIANADDAVQWCGFDMNCDFLTSTELTNKQVTIGTGAQEGVQLHALFPAKGDYATHTAKITLSCNGQTLQYTQVFAYTPSGRDAYKFWPYEAFPLQRRVLIEQFTGTTCSNCPAAYTAVGNSLGQYAENQYVHVSQHTYTGSAYLLNDSKTLAYEYQINTSAPYALACRKGTEQRVMSSPKYSPQAQALTDQAMARNLKESSPVWLTLKGSTYDPMSQTVTIKVKGFADANVPDLRLHLLLTENNLVSYQTGYGVMTHNGVVRAFIANPDPTAAAKTTAPYDNFMENPAYAGFDIDINGLGYFEKTVEYALPNTVNAENCEIVAFVATTRDFRYADGDFWKDDYEMSEVWNVTKASIVDIYQNNVVNDPLKFRMEVRGNDGKYYGTMILPVAVTLPQTAKAFSVANDGSANALTSQTVPASTPVLVASTDSIVSLTPFAVEGDMPSDNDLNGNFVSRLSNNEEYLFLGLQDGAPTFLPLGQTPATSAETYYIKAGKYIPAGRAYLNGTSAVPVEFGSDPLETVLTLTDGTPYDGASAGTTFDRIDYVRNFSNTNWQALYVPFAMDFDDLDGQFDIARLVDVKQWDDNDDGIIDRSALNVEYVTSGTIKANTPYLIKAHETGLQTISVENAEAKAAQSRSLDCTTTELKFVFTGTYSTISDMATQGYYALVDGNLKQAQSNAATLKPYRWYLDIQTRVANAYVPQFISINFDDMTTGILDVTDNGASETFDLTGRRAKADKNGIYIINGKKILK